MINSGRHYCRSNCITFRELDSFAQDVSEVHKRSLTFNTRWKTAEGLPNKNGSSARISSTSGDIVAARWRRARWPRALRARAISKWAAPACQEEFDNNQRLSLVLQNLLLHLLIWRQNVKSFRMRRSATDGVTAEADLAQCDASRLPPPFFFFWLLVQFFFTARPLYKQQVINKNATFKGYRFEEHSRRVGTGGGAGVADELKSTRFALKSISAP